MSNKEFNRRLARFLKDTRKALGYTAPEVAKAINRSVDSIYAYEEGNRTLPFELIVELSNFYGVSIDDLIRSKVTSGRAKAISFDCYGQNKKAPKVIDAQNDDIVLYEEDEWNIKYYVRCSDVRFGSEMLVDYKGTVMPVVISFDDKISVYALHNAKNSKTILLKQKSFFRDIAIIGDYAGSIKKKIQVPNFL